MPPPRGVVGTGSWEAVNTIPRCAASCARQQWNDFHWLARTPLLRRTRGLDISELPQAGTPQKDPRTLKCTIPPPQQEHAARQARAARDPAHVSSISQQEKDVASGGGG